ncbi:unnamed protein product [Adineta steineri]|uniref:Ammonium transporter n=1 Tax=Adineta steineri TaxID=433720 RepID=A0A815E7T1_9BILA|nr:unnamed protein product [Adineta steineri]CAF1303250.1 unnamed protein product [Adineta steineri]
MTEVDTASVAWVLVSTALIWIMIPGIGLFYSGMTKRKSALSMLWLSFMAMAVTSVQWFLIGYSLTFSMSGSRFIGDLAHIASINVLDGPALGSLTIPDIVFCIFQLMFAATSTTIVTGAVCERGRMWPITVFTFVWCTLVYNFVACWIWSPNGWAYTLGALDYAGGTPVHMIAGASALAYSLLLGQRPPVTQIEQSRPHNVGNIFLGTVLSWFGWFGFNGGSGLVIGSRAALACVVTNLAACTGGFTWCMLDYFLTKPRYKFTVFGFCMGSMAGLVCITPGSGYVSAPSSLVFGIGGSTCVYFGRKIKTLLKIDDAFDIFAQHGIGGFVGCLLTGIFAQKYIPALDQVTIAGGWLDGNWIQMSYQLALTGAAFVWSFVMTLIILFIMNKIPGLALRASEEAISEGIDYDQFNEYTHDYIEYQRDLYITQPTSVNSFMTVTPVDNIDNENVVQKQNEIKMVKINTIPTIQEAW